MSTITTTSAFVPFNSPPTPSLLSPPLTTYIQPHHGLPPTKLPSVFLDQRPPRYRRSNEWLFEKSSTPELRPLLQTDRDLPSFGYSLPPLQNVISSPPPPLLTDHGSPREDEDSSSSSRKGSIASILNSESDTCSSSLKRGRPRSTEPSAPKKRKCHQGSRSNNASVVNTINDNAHHQHQRQQQPVRANKGLRHFSKQVCDKVAEKGITTYNEVADELALDIRASAELEGGDKRSFDQKNIRRRVYDALNVLMAMGIIAKDKKQIKWLGISSCYQQQADYQQQQSPLGSEPEEDRYLELQRQLEEEERLQAQLLTSLDQTNGLIRDKLAQHLQVCNLVWRNQHSPQLVSEDQKIPLPFFIVACPSRKDLQVNIAGDGRSAEIEYAAADHRVVYEDADVLRHLELNRVTKDQLAACLPDPSLQSFLSVRHATDSNFINIQSEADLATASS